MTVIGALVRLKETQHNAARQRLEQLPGVTPFDLGDASRLGLVIECDRLDDAYRLLDKDIRGAPGVLCVYPAYAEFES